MFTLLFLFALAVVLSWFWSGWKKIPVGYKGLLLFLGERRHVEYTEGWCWIPLPFGVKIADCRQTVIKLDILEKIITNDNVQVDIEGSIIRQIFDLFKYFDVEESGIKQGLDDIWDATIRSQVADKNLADVLKMHADLALEAKNAMGTEASKSWGINILRVIVASIKPDTKVAEDLALKEREELQRDGQRVEVAHFDQMVNLLVKGGALELRRKGEKEKDTVTISGGLTREQAVEQVQLAIGKASKTVDAKTITLDPVTAALIAEALRRR